MADLRDAQRWPLDRVVVSWSGGVDSSAVLACLLKRGYNCLAVSNSLYDDWYPRYAAREALARNRMRPSLFDLARRHGGSISYDHVDASFIKNFSIPDPDDGSPSMAIPQRNKRFVDLLMARYIIPRGYMNLAMGEYVGVDTWVVRDHVPPNDCDHRALSAYLFSEYGMSYRFMSLADFGESRYKSDRIELGLLAGLDMSLTTNCMANEIDDCGSCYKCVERAAGFDVASIIDRTRYFSDPRRHPAYETYVMQMQGFKVSMPYNAFPQHQ
jgi:7-cyano-7-deazaguanine synthase in queuosine biosynthesis